MGISAIGAQQAASTEQTAADTDQLLDHVAPNPNDGIIYWASDLVISDHSDDGFNNNSKARSRAGDHIFLSGYTPTPKCNGAVLKISQIIKFLMSSAAKAELGAL